ncbi:probable helicase senataxin isoform X2 [Alligator sinensis]|uniref:Probable helicase senataxin isoform X2 n=1 Tax=Alligator sinensis TaxID=38654 RepID=A0A3Q0H9E1_ALLSI|nr:probable helicase senataxin isoform X2 [Alligator sinensis]
MSICRWCTPGASCTTDFLSNYASKRLPPEDLAAASDDLCYCLECVVEYHKARDEVPSLHEALWELETSRLIAHMEKSMKEEIEEDDELFIVDENGETQLSGYTGPDFENNLRVPLLEILKYPYLLLHKRIGELCVEALCKMEQANSSFQVFEKHPGIYLLLVHPNEVIRRWAILTARNLGKVDRDDYYDLQEVLTCLFKVIELGLFDSPDIYCSSVLEKGKLILLPSHLYDSASYKNYWLGICMLLTVLEEQAMDSLLLGPDKQNDFMQSILHTMEKQTDDDNADPFWPALHCFMVILDQLGSKVWGQLIDPVQAFQTIINNVSYNNEIQNIRNSSRRPKTEPESEYGEDMVTCSQIVYNYNTEKPKKDAGWKTAICPDYCPNMYEDMQTLANVLQSDIGQDMRVHNSTFLWFIPFVQSLMDLKDLGVAYIVEVIHHLCSEIKAVLNERVQQCDKVSEFFILILVSIIELHRNKKCLHLLWISSQEWVEAMVKCSKLPNVAFMRHGEKTPAISSQSFNSVQYACVQLIRSLLREGYQIGQQTLCKQYLDKLNLLLRGNISLGWHLSIRETQELQTCLKQVIKSIKDKSTSSSSLLENSSICTTSSTVPMKQERGKSDDRCKMKTHPKDDFSPSFSSACRRDEVCPQSPSPRRGDAWEEEYKIPSVYNSYATTDCFLTNVKKELSGSSVEHECQTSFVTTDKYRDIQKNENNPQVENYAKNSTLLNQGCSPDLHCSDLKSCGVLEANCKTGARLPAYLTAQPCITSEDICSSSEKDVSLSLNACSSFKVDDNKLSNLKTNIQRGDLATKLLQLMKSSPHLKKNKANDAPNSGTDQPQSRPESMLSKEDCSKDLGVNVVHEGEMPISCHTPNVPESQQGRGLNGIVQIKPLSAKQEQSNAQREFSSFFKKEVDLPKNEVGGGDDNHIPCTAIIGNLPKKRSHAGRSSSSSKYLLNKDLNAESSDQEQSNFGNLHPRQDACKEQIVNKLHVDEISVGVSIPPVSSSEGGRPSNTPQISLHSIKRESEDRPLTISRYFKREGVLERKNDESKEAIACDLANRISGSRTLTDSQLDRDLHKLSLAAYAKGVNFSLDSSQEILAQHCLPDVMRKVKGTVRCSSNGPSNETSFDTDCPSNQVIIISDSSSDDEKKIVIEKQTEKIDESICPEKQPLTSACVSDGVSKKEQMKSHSSPLPYEEYESQYFEFETEDDVFSVWQDSQMDDKNMNQAREQVPSASSCSSNNLQLEDETNEWGYDTDYISDDIIEQAAKDAEKQISSVFYQKKVSTAEIKCELTSQEPAIKRNAADQVERSYANPVAKHGTKKPGLTELRTSKSKTSLAKKLAVKKGSASPSKSLAKSKVARAACRSPRKMNLKTTQNKKLPQASCKNTEPCRSTPAVVPPKKVRQCPKPTSTAEKLGLKKAPRKAFELSQRSLESMAELRNYGRVAGSVTVPQKQKTILIDPQNLRIKNNKKMLASQDLQFLRQTRPKPEGRGKNRVGSSESRKKRLVKRADPTAAIQQPTAFDSASATRTNQRTAEQVGCLSTQDKIQMRKSCSSDREEVQPIPMFKMPASAESTSETEGKNSTVPVLPYFPSPLAAEGKSESAEKDCIVQGTSLLALQCQEAYLKENMFKLNENDDNDLFLTQSDPVDMEMCSQLENIIILPSKEPLEMEVNAAESLLQNDPSNIVMCKYKDCTEKVEKTGEYCSKHSLIDSSDHLFVKPLPPKIAKPPTTKIFSSNSSSRSASLTKDLEKSSKFPLVSKNKLNAVKPAASKPVSPKAVSSENQVFKTPSFNSILRPQNSSNVLRAQNMQTKAVSNFQGWPASQTCVGQEKRVSYFPQSNTLITVQRDPSIFVKEVLKWNYEIFANFGSFGPPNSLLQAIVASVPVKFQGYNDYFDTFFPLMMLNAFETLAQEWQESQKAKEKNAYHLHLKKFSADLNQAEFTVYIQERDLVKQLHPKEDDLIFLVVREKQNPLAEESEMDCRPVRHVGHVTRFSRTSFREMGQNEQHIVCHLFVQTRGNLSSYINQQVKCEVVSSLVTTQRKFRGLLLLGRSPLAKAIVHPDYNDFCPRDLSTASERTTSYYKEYNEDQKKAIETAYAMVKQHPGLPRICLIHGPPGTGKSKTIVGLLFRILNEKSGKENPAQNMNAKIKRNRVLVCAPSNAAVDELMKKIILEFKEKCQNKKNPLGNCGDINLVRLGPQKSISIDVLRFSLDSQVSYRMNRGHSGRDQDIHKRKEALDRQLDMLSRQRAMDRCEKREKSQQLDDEIGRLSKERQELASQLKKVRGRPQEVQGSIILESHIICCTLSTSGGFLLESAFRRQGLDPFSCVIVDEAGQACEVETLIPLIHRCSKLVLVGDPKQLPPTVISMKAQDYGYDQSLMARLHKHLEEQVQQNVIGKLPVVQLTVQYRMHPDICLFPSNYVYGKTLKTDRATEESRCSSDWPFQPYLVFDVADGHEKRDKDSFTNPQEVKLVVELIKTIKEKRKDTGSRNIGIITPYNAQKKIIQQELDREFGKDRAGEVDTVDGFQGRQKDCIIVTCVRANSAHGSIGFLASLQRLNVTITRAKLSLFILGRLKTLMENKDWNELIQDAQRRGAIIKTCDKTYKKDAAKILKFKPALPRPPPRCPSTVLPEKATRGQPCSGSDRQIDVTNKKDSNSSRSQSDSAGPLAQDSGGLKRPQESQGSDTRGVAVPTEAKAAVQPAVRERLRDPRLAKRTEATGKEQAFKDGKPSPLRNPGMTSRRASDSSSALRSQSSTVPPSVSKADTSTKSSQSERQPDLPVRSSHIARQDHDKNASVTTREAGTKSEGDQKNKTEGNKDRTGLHAQRRASERSTEDTGSSSAKRRKISS